MTPLVLTIVIFLISTLAGVFGALLGLGGRFGATAAPAPIPRRHSTQLPPRNQSLKPPVLQS